MNEGGVEKKRNISFCWLNSSKPKPDGKTDIFIYYFCGGENKRNRKFYPNTKHLKLNNSNWASHHKSKAWPGSMRFEKSEEKKSR